MRAAAIRAKVREYGGLITEEQASEKIHDEMTPTLLPMLERLAVRTGNAAFFRDLEKYKDIPAVAILKHYNYSDLIHRRSNYVIMTITKIANNLKCAIFLRRSTHP